MSRIDHEKENRRQRRRLSGKVRDRRKTTEERQAALLRFVLHHKVDCFGCGKGGEIRWAKSGISSRGPWAICVDCVCKNKR